MEKWLGLYPKGGLTSHNERFMKNYISEAEKYVKNKGWIESIAIDKACQTKCTV